MRHDSIFHDAVERAETNGVSPYRFVRNPIHVFSPLTKRNAALVYGQYAIYRTMVKHG